MKYAAACGWPCRTSYRCAPDFRYCPTLRDNRRMQAQREPEGSNFIVVWGTVRGSDAERFINDHLREHGAFTLILGEKEGLARPVRLGEGWERFFEHLNQYAREHRTGLVYCHVTDVETARAMLRYEDDRRTLIEPVIPEEIRQQLSGA